MAPALDVTTNHNVPSSDLFSLDVQDSYAQTVRVDGRCTKSKTLTIDSRFGSVFRFWHQLVMTEILMALNI